MRLFVTAAALAALAFAAPAAGGSGPSALQGTWRDPGDGLFIKIEGDQAKVMFALRVRGNGAQILLTQGLVLYRDIAASEPYGASCLVIGTASYAPCQLELNGGRLSARAGDPAGQSAIHAGSFEKRSG